MQGRLRVELRKLLVEMTEVIAEIGWNHMGDDSAKQMIQEAANSGATFASFEPNCRSS